MPGRRVSVWECFCRIAALHSVNRLEKRRSLTAKPLEVEVLHHALQQPVTQRPVQRRLGPPRTRPRRLGVQVAHENDEVAEAEHRRMQDTPAGADLLPARRARRRRRHVVIYLISLLDLVIYL